MADEKGYIIHAFQRSFQSRKSEKICLYGTGRHTWELLNNLKEYNIIGVADFSYVGREHSVLNVADAAKADFIVIIARPMLKKKLYTKIRQSIINIPVYTIEGDDLDQVFGRQNLDECFKKINSLAVSEQNRYIYNRLLHKCKEFLRQEDKKLVITDIYALVNVFMAPFMVNLFFWVIQEAIKNECELLLFQARDGYIFYQLYQEELSRNTMAELPEACYFYASRQSVIAATRDPEAEANYCQYLKAFSLDNYEKICLYDFGARGTVQYHLQQIMQRELLGLYYMKLPLDSGTIDVTSYCQHEMNFYEMRTFAQVFYPLMEALFEAPHGSLKGFNHEGTPILEEYYGNENTKKVIFTAVMDYYREYRSIWGAGKAPLVSVQLLDSCMDLLREPQIVFSEEVKKAFVLQDSFQKETLNFADDILI